MAGLQPFDPWSLLVLALVNPAVIIVGILMGRAANQWQKIIVAGFVAAIAGAAAVWLGAFLRLVPARGLGGEAGLFALQLLVGCLWATAAYTLRRRA